MDNVIQIIESLLKYVSITFLIYCSLNSSYKLFFKKSYTISDFRISLITLIFIFFKLSISFLSAFFEVEFNSIDLITFTVVLIGFYLHNKTTEPRKKFFRLFVFYLLGLLCMIY